MLTVYTRGYINDAPATAATFSSDGWLRTGDIMRVDADGDFWVTDRLKEVCFCFCFHLLRALVSYLITYPDDQV